MATALKQKEAKRYEEVEAGRYKLAVVATATGGDATVVLAAEAAKARQKQERLVAAVAGLAAAEAAAGGSTAPQLSRVLAHAVALGE